MAVRPLTAISANLSVFLAAIIGYAVIVRTFALTLVCVRETDPVSGAVTYRPLKFVTLLRVFGTSSANDGDRKRVEVAHSENAHRRSAANAIVPCACGSVHVAHYGARGSGVRLRCLGCSLPDDVRIFSACDNANCPTPKCTAHFTVIHPAGVADDGGAGSGSSDDSSDDTETDPEGERLARNLTAIRAELASHIQEDAELAALLEGIDIS